MSKLPPKPQNISERTRLVHAGREPFDQYGFINTPIYRGSTVLYPTTDDLLHRRGRYSYGTKGTPTTNSLETAWTELTGAAGTVLAPSGLAAVTLGTDVLPQVRRPPAGDGFGLPADTSLLQRRAQEIWCGNHLLRSADRRRDRSPDPAEHRRGVDGSPRITIASRCRTFPPLPRWRTGTGPWS